MNDEPKTCLNCGRFPCKRRFYHRCSRSDFERKHLLPIDHWTPSDYTQKMDRGGCYDCCKLCGTMTNQKTGTTIAICEEHLLMNAPHPKDGCDKSESYYSDSRVMKRKRLTVEKKWRDFANGKTIEESLDVVE